jgi:hypothetical protein
MAAIRRARKRNTPRRIDSVGELCEPAFHQGQPRARSFSGRVECISILAASTARGPKERQAAGAAGRGGTAVPDKAPLGPPARLMMSFT